MTESPELTEFTVTLIIAIISLTVIFVLLVFILFQSAIIKEYKSEFESIESENARLKAELNHETRKNLKLQSKNEK